MKNTTKMLSLYPIIEVNDYFQQCLNISNEILGNLKIITNIQIKNGEWKERWIFSYRKCFTSTLCIFRTFHERIALIFKYKFRHKKKLTLQNKKRTWSNFNKPPKRNIYYFITKEKIYEKPTYEWNSLECLEKNGRTLFKK